MTPLNATLLALAVITLAVVLPLRRRALTRGSGHLAQLDFKRRHGAELTRLLAGDDVPTDTNVRSPWVNIELGGRAARMLAARIDPARLQAGVDLSSWQIPVEIWHTTGATHELDVPDNIDYDTVLGIVGELRALGVDNIASAAAGPFVRHLMRVQFATIDELPAIFARIAPLLDRLEALGADVTPS
ncbi:MAG: hypothetical protein JWN41_536 [Thermoleophilia bacterium]|nr:hypothetical protein [Thermoleophilia bacterium]